MQYATPAVRHFIVFFLWVLLIGTKAHGLPYEKNDVVKQGIADKVVQEVMKSALAPPSTVESNELSVKDLIAEPIHHKEIQNYLHSFDPWASFTMQNAHPLPKNTGSLGMTLILNKKNQIICVPYPHSPASKAGIKEGDILLGIQSLDAIATTFRGPIGSTLTLSVERENAPHTYTLTREKFTAPTVSFTQHKGFARIRIWHFAADTHKLFAEKLRLVGNQTLVIDIRSNSGGNILAARNCAAEFLPKQSLLGISQIRVNESNTLLRRQNIHTVKNGSYQNIPLIIWQDSLTASAAEAFVVALVDNKRATSLGESTFGKAHAQSSFYIDGTLLRLSTEALLRLDGSSWENSGVRANTAIHPSAENLTYITQQIISSKESGDSYEDN